MKYTASTTTRTFRKLSMAVFAVTCTCSSLAANAQSWEAAEPFTFNTPSGEGCPIETQDGKSLLFASTRPGGAGGLDIWVADRAFAGGPWQDVNNLEMEGVVNTDANDFCPTPVGRSMLFVSEKQNELNCSEDENSPAADIYITRQSPAGGWSEPMHLGCAPNGPNTPGPERSPFLISTPDSTLLFFSTLNTTDYAEPNHDIYVSTVDENGYFSAPFPVTALNTPYNDFMPNVRATDTGYEIAFNSDRPSWGRPVKSAYGGQDVYTAVAPPSMGSNPAILWKAPENAGSGVNTSGNESRATLSFDGTRLHFGRDGDIYVSHRPE